MRKNLMHGLAMLLLAALSALPARAEKVIVGTVGAASAAPWPLYIGMDEGFFKNAGLEIDLVYAPSVAGLIQQLTGASLDIVASAGLVDPTFAVQHGAAVSIVRIEGQVAPYALLGNAKIKSLKELKGKTVSIDETTGITLTYLQRMLVPNGLKTGDYDLIYAGATSARFAALKSGAADAAMLNPPASFVGIEEGYTNLGFVYDYAKDLPFSGTIVLNSWANAHKKETRAFIDAYTKSIAWFYDTKNRDKAMQDLVDHTKQKPAMVATTYDFLHKIQFFEPTGKVSLKLVGNIAQALKDQKALDAGFDVNRLILPGITELAPN